MKEFRKKISWHHVLIILIVIIVAIGLLTYPLEVPARSMVVIQHEDNFAKAQANNQADQQRAQSIINAQRARDDAQREVDRARNDVYQAYIPSSPLYEPTRQFNIDNAWSNLDEATNNYRNVDQRLYLLQRERESQLRDEKIRREYKQLKQQQQQQMHRNKSITPHKKHKQS